MNVSNKAVLITGANRGIGRALVHEPRNGARRGSSSFAAGGYLGVYSRMQLTWRLTLGEVDGEPSVILLHKRGGTWEIAGIVRRDLRADGRIERVSDYQHCPWTLRAGSIVVRESVL